MLSLCRSSKFLLGELVAIAITLDGVMESSLDQYVIRHHIGDHYTITSRIPKRHDDPSYLNLLIKSEHYGHLLSY